jgi:hypothetical protein
VAAHGVLFSERSEAILQTKQSLISLSSTAWHVLTD